MYQQAVLLAACGIHFQRRVAVALTHFFQLSSICDIDQRPGTCVEYRCPASTIRMLASPPRRFQHCLRPLLQSIRRGPRATSGISVSQQYLSRASTVSPLVPWMRWFQGFRVSRDPATPALGCRHRAGRRPQRHLKSLAHLDGGTAPRPAYKRHPQRPLGCRFVQRPAQVVVPPRELLQLLWSRAVGQPEVQGLGVLCGP
jgi:hypothetical protein